MLNENIQNLAAWSYWLSNAFWDCILNEGYSFLNYKKALKGNIMLPTFWIQFQKMMS